MTDLTTSKTNRNVIFLIIVASLGYFVDIYDLLVFSIVRTPSLLAIGVKADDVKTIGISILNWQMCGLLIGGILWGVVGDRLGRIRVLFGSILLYSIANFVNGYVSNVEVYKIVRFVAGIGLAGELGAGITLVTETMKKENRGYGTMIVSVIGLFGAAFANIVATYWHWDKAYMVGGCLGILLLILRLGTYESGMYKNIEKNEAVSRGNFLMLFTSFKRFWKYLCCIFVGASNWFVIGILITLAPEFGKALHATKPLSAGDGVFYAYIGIAVGGLLAGLLSQVTKSRRLAVLVFLFISAGSVVAYLTANNITPRQFAWLAFFLGVGVGYWPIFVTIPAEQFGTNIRATVTTTVPNFIRASLIPISAAFTSLSIGYGMINASYILMAILTLIAMFSLTQLKESFGKDLDYLE